MRTECPFSDKCKGAALCPSSDDACPSVAEARIEQLTTERDQARCERDEALEVLGRFVSGCACIHCDDMATCIGCDIPEDCALKQACTIVAKYGSAETNPSTEQRAKWGADFDTAIKLALRLQCGVIIIAICDRCGMDLRFGHRDWCIYKALVPACCVGCLHDHGGTVGCGEFPRRPVGKACGARAEGEEEGA